MNKLLIIGGVLIFAVVAVMLLRPADQAATPVVEVDDAAMMNDNDMDDMTPPAETTTIVDLAVATPDLSTLVEAVVAAGLVDTLAGAGPFTVLAPQNSAFADLPEGTLESLLLPENVEQLQTILANHVVSGAALSTDLQDGMMIPTLAGTELPVEIAADGTVTIGGATVVAADIIADNGVVHVIDTVILPN